MKALSLALLLAACGVASAQVRSPLPPPGPPIPIYAPLYTPAAPVELPIAVPAAPVQHLSRYAAPPQHGHSRMNHLLEAARHLDAAGYADQAHEVRQKAHEQQRLHVRRLIDQKLAEIESLKTQLAQLDIAQPASPHSSPSPRQVMFDFTLYEVACQQACDACSKLDRLNTMLEDSDLVHRELETLEKLKLIKVLAQPTLITMTGRPAFFRTGGELPVKIIGPDGTGSVSFKPLGVQVHVLPVALPQNKLRVEFKIRWSRAEGANSVVVEGNSYPELSIREIDSGVEIESGKTLILNSARVAGPSPQPAHPGNSPAGGTADEPSQPHAGQSTPHLLVIMTPRIIDDPQSAIPELTSPPPRPHAKKAATGKLFR